MHIRRERKTDNIHIEHITKLAFENHPVSQQTEHFIINALQNANALSLSLVAEVEGRIVGHIAFSPVSISDGNEGWFGIGPVSVHPDYQRRGIGKALMESGIEIMKENGARGCALVGDPSYYKRFGFKNTSELIHEGISQEFFMILPFGNDDPSGTIQFHTAFEAKS